MEAGRYYHPVDRHAGRIFIYCVLLHSVILICSANTDVYIGILYGEQYQSELAAMELAVKYVNARDDFLPNVTIHLFANHTSDLTNRFSYMQKVCYQLEKRNVQFVIGPEVSDAVKAVSYILEGLHIPQIAPFATNPTLSLAEEDFPYLMKLSPPDQFQAEALADIAATFTWTKFAIIASNTDYGRNGVKEFMNIVAKRNWQVRHVTYFLPIKKPETLDMTDELTEIKLKGLRVVILWCKADHARAIVKTAVSLDMLGDTWSWLVTDGVTLLWPELYGDGPVPGELIGLLGTRPHVSNGALYPHFRDVWNNITGHDTPEEMAKMSFDAMLVIADALNAYFEGGGQLSMTSFPPDLCSNSTTEPWVSGSTIIKNLEAVDSTGVSQRLAFNKFRYTVTQEYDVVNLQHSGWVKLGEWDDAQKTTFRFNATSVIFPGNKTSASPDFSLNISHVHFSVVLILEQPYCMYTTESERRDNPDVEFKGFSIDLLNTLQQDMGFTYDIHLVEDGFFGIGEKNNGTVEWNGIVAELIEGKANLTTAPLAATVDRKTVIDTTFPFQDAAFAILLAKEAPSDNFWAFLEPFEWDLWYTVAASFFICAAMTSCLAFVSPFGYRGRHIQRRKLSETKFAETINAMNMHQSLWYTLGAFVGQGTGDVTPMAFSSRVVFGTWWVVVLVVISNYTATLAAYLTVARLDSGISTASDLAAQDVVKYLTIANSASYEFFALQTVNPYRIMYEHMARENNWVMNTSQGIQRVRDSYGKPLDQRQAFVFFTPQLDDAANREPCNIETTGNNFKGFSYVLGLPKNSRYTELFDIKILKYRQNGRLDTLIAEWFSTTCSVQNAGSDSVSDQSSVDSMAGVFVFLFIGFIAAAGSLIIECLIATWKDTEYFQDKAMKGPKTMGSAFRRRLKKTLKAIYEDFLACKWMREMGIEDFTADVSNQRNKMAAKINVVGAKEQDEDTAVKEMIQWKMFYDNRGYNPAGDDQPPSYEQAMNL